MGNVIHLHFPDNYDRSLAPVPAPRDRDWWADNKKTENHARHCLPLVMANSLGYYILSPGTFLVRWNGDIQEHAVVEVIDGCSHCIVDNHAAFGSFTVQAAFIPRTEDTGEYVYIKGVANERGMPYSCMEAAVEAWWSAGNFGLVYMLNQPGEFMIRKGQPIAQMFLYKAVYAEITMQGPHPEHAAWLARRSRPEYRKDLDYMKGKYADGRDAPDHLSNWKAWKNELRSGPGADPLG